LPRAGEAHHWPAIGPSCFSHQQLRELHHGL